MATDILKEGHIGIMILIIEKYNMVYEVVFLKNNLNLIKVIS